MFELFYKSGFSVLAEYKEELGWFDLQGYKLNVDDVVWSEELN